MGGYVAAPDLARMGLAGLGALLLSFGLSWAMDRLFLRRLVKDRIACIAYGCIFVFLLLMGGTTFYLTRTTPYRLHSIIIPPVGYAICFLLGCALAGYARMAIYSRYEGNLDEAIVFEPDYDDPRLYDEQVLAWDEKHGHRSYLLRHWVGHLSLPVSYWVNGALLPALILALVEFIAVEVKAKWASLQALSAVALIYLLVSLIVWVWSSVGIWRSAYWHRRRGGSAGWGLAARTLVLIGAAGAIYRSGDLALQARELGHLAVGEDTIGAVAAMSVSKDGRELMLKGPLAEGAADRFQTVLDASPKVREIALSSPGGRMFEAEKMADAVHKRGLDTRVVDQCMSACTTVLLAGRERSAPRTAQIGFHQPTFPGLRGAELDGMIRHARDEYVAAGVNEAFVWHAMATPASSIWVPTPDELHRRPRPHRHRDRRRQRAARRPGETGRPRASRATRDAGGAIQCHRPGADGRLYHGRPHRSAGGDPYPLLHGEIPAGLCSPEGKGRRGGAPPRLLHSGPGADDRRRRDPRRSLPGRGGKADLDDQDHRLLGLLRGVSRPSGSGRRHRLRRFRGDAPSGRTCRRGRRPC